MVVQALSVKLCSRIAVKDEQDATQKQMINCLGKLDTGTMTLFVLKPQFEYFSVLEDVFK